MTRITLAEAALRSGVSRETVRRIAAQAGLQSQPGRQAAAGGPAPTTIDAAEWDAAFAAHRARVRAVQCPACAVLRADITAALRDADDWTALRQAIRAALDA